MCVRVRRLVSVFMCGCIRMRVFVRLRECSCFVVDYCLAYLLVLLLIIVVDINAVVGVDETSP